MKNKNNKINGYKNNDDDIVVVGMSCRFPDAENYQEFWKNLDQNKNSIKEITVDRWDIEKFYSTDISQPRSISTRWCGLINDIKQFDSYFFNISPREAKNIDPQHRVAMEETWHCIEDSGISLSDLQKDKTSVIVGMSTGDYSNRILESIAPIDSYASLGNYKCVVPNRISYMYNFTGESFAVDTACASSLVAVHKAKQLLTNRQCKYVFVLAVNLCLHPWRYISFTKSGMLSPDGQCKTFDKDANGFVPGEGCGVILLQRMGEAKKEKNHIYGVIKGTAVNHVGKSISITAPSVKAQKEVILAACQDAQISPADYCYIEAHGTGTSLGDPIEIEALTQAVREFTDEKQFCKVGSAKTNIGHLEAAAGLAGLIKTLLILKYQKIPASLNIKTANPVIDFFNSPFQVAHDNSPLKQKNESIPKHIGVSAFGFSGVNAHIVVKEYQDINQEKAPDMDKKFFLLSAKSQTSLETTVKKWRQFIQGPDYQCMDLADICSTLMANRTNFSYRFGSIVQDKSDLEKLLLENITYSQKKKIQTIFLLIGETEEVPKINFLELSRYKIPLIKEKTTTMIEKLKKVHEKLGNELQENGTIQSCPKINIFLLVYLQFELLNTLDLLPDLIGNEKKGVWFSLYFSGIISFSEIILLLAGEIKVEDLHFCLPKIRFYDSVNKQIIQTNHFENNHLEMLVKYLNISESQDSQYIEHYLQQNYLTSLQLNIYEIDPIMFFYIHKTRLLLESQYTFINFIKEWDVVFEKYGLDFYQLIHSSDLLKKSISTNSNIQKVVLLVIQSTLDKLYQKWSLTKLRIIKDDQFYQLVNLINHDFISKESLLKLFLDTPVDFKAIFQLLLERKKQQSRLFNELFKLEKQPLNNIILDPIKWVGQLQNQVCELDDPYYNYYCGKVSKKLDPEISFQIDTNHNWLKSFQQLLLTLWKTGKKCNWEKWSQSGSYNKVSLPVYSFDKVDYWVAPAKDKQYKEIQVVQDKVSNHPIVEYQQSLPGEERYEVTITGKEPFFTDYQLYGKNFIPNFYLIEWIYSSIRKSKGKSKFLMNQIIWNKPLTIDLLPIQLQISLYKYNHSIKFEVSKKNDKKNHIFIQGFLTQNIDMDTAINTKALILDSIKHTLTKRKLTYDVYQLLKNYNFNYGPFYQNINDYYYNETESLFFNRLNPYFFNKKIYLYPSLLENIIIAVHNNINSEELEQGHYLPYAIKKLYILQPVEDSCYIYLKFLQSEYKQFSDKKIKVVITDKSGLILLIMEELKLRIFLKNKM